MEAADGRRTCLTKITAPTELLCFSLEPEHEQASIGNKSLNLPHYTLQQRNYSLFLSILTFKEA
jgi:hypothetical protein